jgi:predicted Fe-Mo cluster-binding NifX family protein
MRICVPVQDDRGLQAPVNAHFGSAPYFLIHDTGTGQSVLLPNGEEAHAHGQCHPLQSIASQQVDVVLCGGIGRRALDLLEQAGMQVCLASAGTADGAIRAYSAGTLAQLDPGDACQQHNCD